MAVAQGFNKSAGTDALIFMYDTGDTTNCYLGEPTTNLLPNGVAAVHDAASGNAVTVTDATAEKGPGWKKVTITARGSNFRTLQWTYLEMSANITYCFSAVFDWGNMRGKNYFIYFDGTGTGVRNYYRPGNYSTPASSNIDPSMPDGKFAGTIINTSSHVHSFFIGNYTTNISGLDDYFYYKEFQAEVNIHPTQYTSGTRSATQGLLDLTRTNTINISSTSFNSNAQIYFDGTDDVVTTTNTFPSSLSQYTIEYVAKLNAAGRMPIAYFPNTNFYKYGDFSWYYTHGGISDEFYYPGGSITGWGYWAITYDGSNVKIYRNGQYLGAKASSGTADFSGGWRIGYWSAMGGYAWDGEIPVVKIYNTALTEAETQNNYQNYKTRFNLP
jgi:hypothetical protein